MRRPVVIVPACTRLIGDHRYHAVQQKYIDAVVRGAGCVPLIVPALGEAVDMASVLAVCDGVMLTGSASNVHASWYGEDLRDPALPLDPARDATTMPLVRAAMERGLPVFAICRGFQELNVALGGTLHQAVQDVPGMMDHREDLSAPLDIQYGPAHPVSIVEGGMLARILGGVGSITVNSLHGQGVNRLGQGIVAEATAPDSLVEAFSIPASPFVLGVQWHPEWNIENNPDSLKIFGAFGEAVRLHQQQRMGQS